jgi:hypothetical protein
MTIKIPWLAGKAKEMDEEETDVKDMLTDFSREVDQYSNTARDLGTIANRMNVENHIIAGAKHAKKRHDDQGIKINFLDQHGRWSEVALFGQHRNTVLDLIISNSIDRLKTDKQKMDSIMREIVRRGDE